MFVEETSRKDSGGKKIDSNTRTTQGWALECPSPIPLQLAFNTRIRDDWQGLKDH